MFDGIKSPITLTKKDSVAVITFDSPTANVNTISSKLAKELERLLSDIQSDSTIQACVVCSGKKDNFVAGADIEELFALKTQKEAEELSQMAQTIMNRIQNFPKPIVAAINGTCLGGGLEFILACHYRIASTNSKTVFGLPEVMLGLLPGAGGTQRLPKKVALETALDMMLTGRFVKAEKAKKIGLVDYLAPANGLLNVAIEAAQKLAQKPSALKTKTLKTPVLKNNAAYHALVFSQARKTVLSKTKGNYPAPLAIIDAVEAGFKKGFSAGLMKEAHLFGELAQTSISKSLIYLFFQQSAHKKNSDYKTQLPLKKLGLLGAGFMGAGIATVSLQKNMNIIMKDISEQQLGKAQKMIWDGLSTKVKRKSLSSFERSQALSEIQTTVDYESLADCDVIIEAVFEDLEIKQKLIREVEPHLKPNCVFATNTSALPITEIAKASTRPEWVLGMHYFSPVHKMPLLEIITHKKTCKDAIGQAVNLGLKQGKTVLVVSDGPGFFTTRVIAPFTDEAAMIALEGTPISEIDSLMQKFGYPVGPIQLMDEVGIDVGAHVIRFLHGAFGERMSNGEFGAIDEMVKLNCLGRKTGKGFYLYNKKSKLSFLTKKGRPENTELASKLLKYKKKPVVEKISQEDIQKRMAYRMINEAIYCLQEGILNTAEDGDLGAVFGIGFPPFHGGPFRYVDTLGPQKICDDMKRFTDTFGMRFEPAQLLKDVAAKNGKFLKN